MMNYQKFNKFRESLANRLLSGCEDAVDIIKAETPVDTKRLYTTTRTKQPEISKDFIRVNIVIGGQSLYGILREQGIEKPVFYAIYQERKNNYIRGNLSSIENAIIAPLKK